MHAEHVTLKDPSLMTFPRQKKSFMIPKSLKQQNRGQNCVVNIEEILRENLHGAHVRNY